ncbi:hypothetical protein BH10PAT3_BH10PAT3_6760 [soil metagenome]
MDKRKLHHLLVLMRNIHYYALIGLCVLFAVIALLALRGNNQRMVVLRSAVFTADEKNGDTETALQNLRKYVFAHMNTGLASGANAVKPPIQLKYRYERLAAAEKAAYDAANAQMLSSAEATCVAQYPGSVFSQPRLECAKAYAASHAISQKTIPDDLYKFDFASPKWSPDLAGWSIVLAVFFLLLFVIRFASEQLIRTELKSRS